MSCIVSALQLRTKKVILKDATLPPTVANPNPHRRYAG